MDLYPLNRRCWVCFNFPDPTGQSMAHWRHVPAKEWPQSVHDAVGNLPDYRDRGRIIDGVRVGEPVQLAVNLVQVGKIISPTGVEITCECGYVAKSDQALRMHMQRAKVHQAVTA